MRCPRCNADNPAGMKFCGQCGAGLGSACPSCGSANPPEHRFCGQCGAPLNNSAARASPAGSALPGEMKQVTVLFCDIVDSTPLTDRLGAEAMRDLVSSFLETSLAEVHRYGGTAPQFTGDGFMALFGAPVSQEDHVQRALLAALGIRHALGGARDAQEDQHLNLPIRIGIHTGPAVFGPVAEQLVMNYTVIGDTANLAARLQTAAEPGTILISEATRLLARGYARVEPVGPLTLKGKPEPIRAYRLLGASHRRPEFADAATGLAAFVDRENELAILNNLFAQVERGHGQAVGLVGEPGIGKSRLLAEFRRKLGGGRVTWVEGRCLSYGTAIPYLLVLDLLRSSCGIAETDVPKVVADKVRAGLRAVGMDPDADSLVLLHLLEIKEVAGSPVLSNPEAVKSKTFETLCQLTTKGSQPRPLILALEDLHWVDRISEEFLGFLTENVRDARVLLLATYRPGYRPPWLDKSYAGQTPLQALSADDSTRMVRSVLVAEHLVDLVTQEIVAKGDGNPFFLEQLALHAGEAEDLRSGLMVPDTIHDVVMARIDRLPEQTKRLLQIAAVIGREFPLRLLQAVWRGQTALEDRLRELVRLEFIYERVDTQGPVYVFRHALTQETAYGSLLERHRRTYHGAVGLALEELYSGRTDEVAELLALHFGHSDDAEKAVDYAIAAAEKSQRRWANSEALHYFNDALQRLDLLPATEPNRLRRIDAVIKQAEVKFALGQHAEHIAALDKIAEIVDQANDPRRRATWHYWRGFLGVLTGGQPDTAIDHCNVAARLAADVGLDDIKAFAQSCLAQVYTVVGRLRDAVEVGESALSSFEARGNLWWAGRTLWHLSVATNCLGQWDVSLAYCKRALDHGVVLGDLRLEAVSWLRMGSAHIQRGDLERGFDCCSKALEFTPNAFDTTMAKGIRGYGEIKAGRIEAGIAELGAAVGWFESSALRYTYLHQALWLAEGHLLHGDYAAARPRIEGVLNTSRISGYRHFEGRACWLMSECLAADASAAAENYAETAIDILDSVGARNDLAKAMVTRAALHQRAGDAERARVLLEKAYATFRILGTRGEAAQVETALTGLDRGLPIRLLSGGS